MKLTRFAAAALAAVAFLTGCADLTYDATAPTVAIVYPVSWSTHVRDTIEIRADAYDNIQLDRVDFFVNGESLATVEAAPFHVRWYPDTTGGHTVYCVAYDAAGNEAHTSPVVVTVTTDAQVDLEPPYVALVRPVSWSTFEHDTIDIIADADDNTMLDRVIFYADGESIATATTAPWHARWFPDTTGYHTVHCVAWDTAGNDARTSPAVVVITGEQPDLEPPYVALVRPASWSVVLETVRIEAIARDNRSVDRVAFFLDGDSLVLFSAAPWIHYWDSRSVGNGYHTIYASAIDSAGNLAYSAVLTVDVENTP